MKRKLIQVALGIWLLTILPMPPLHFSQAMPTTLPDTADVILTDVTGYESAGVYLGHGLILTSARNVTAERLLWNPVEGQAPELRYQLWDYVEDGINHPWEEPLAWQVCPTKQKNSYVLVKPPTDVKQAHCFAYNLTTQMTITHQGEPNALPVENLLYVNRVNDIALLSVDEALLKTTWPDLASTTLDARPLAAQTPIFQDEATYYVGDNTPLWRTQPLQAVPDDSQQQTPVLAVVSQAPILGKWQVNPPSIGQAYYSEAGVIGLNWADQLMTPVQVWVNELWLLNEQLQSPALAAVLNETIWPDEVRGAPTIGDRFTPELGNAGYDVLHYNLNLNIDPATVSVSGEVELLSRAIWHHLKTFTVDLLDEATVESVYIDDVAAEFVQQDNKVWITLPDTLDFGIEFTTQIAYHVQPKPHESAYTGYFTVGLEYSDDPLSLAFANQPDGARSWFPCNDHPQDRATYHFAVTVPDGFWVVANGQPAGKDGQTFEWDLASEMATYLATIAVGDYELYADMTSSGVPLRTYYYRGTGDDIVPLFSSTNLAFEYFEALFGAYPYESYGHVVTPLQNGALETQTMTIMPQSLSQAADETQIFTLMAHELAHQWYGNAVSLNSWEDIWLNEGFATYAEWLVLDLRYPQQDDALRARTSGERRIRNSQRLSPLAHPFPPELFGADSYQKGAWVLYMLQNQIGDAAFFEVLHIWRQAYTERPVTTLDFFQLAELVSNQDLTEFRRTWLETNTLPSFPIHWQTTDTGIELQVCNFAKSAQSKFIEVALLDTDGNPYIVDVDIYAKDAQQFNVAFDVTDVVVDPRQQVLDGIVAESVEKLSCLSLNSGVSK